MQTYDEPLIVVFPEKSLFPFSYEAAGDQEVKLVGSKAGRLTRCATSCDATES
jgi:predicted amidohydrolase